MAHGVNAVLAYISGKQEVTESVDSDEFYNIADIFPSKAAMTHAMQTNMNNFYDKQVEAYKEKINSGEKDVEEPKRLDTPAIQDVIRQLPDSILTTTLLGLT